MLTEKDVVDTLTQKVFAVVGAPDSITNVRTDRVFLSICMPGIPLPPAALDFGFTTMSPDQIERAADFSNFVNIVPQWGQSWRPSGKTLTQQYQKVIDQPVLPSTELSEPEKALYAQAHDLLWVKQRMQNALTGEIVEIDMPSLWQQRYDEYKKLHANALNRYLLEQSNYIAHMSEPGQAERWAQLKPILESDIRDALNQWEAAGKRKVEEARATIGNMDGRGLQASWQDRRSRFTTYRKNAQIGDFWLTKYYPGKFWEPEAGWLSLSLSHEEVHKVDEREQVSWGGGVSASFGLWSIGGDVSYESQKTMASCDVSSFSVSFELAMVPLLRGWLDEEVFSSRSWKFDSNIVSASELLSDGQMPPQGTMPMFPTAMLLARNVRINFDKSSEVNKTFMETIRGSASVGWGPFSVRANYYKRTDRSSHDFVEDTAGLSVAGMQVIGFVCKLLDKCPDPDPALHWPA
jgi:hypothetical protein